MLCVFILAACTKTFLHEHGYDLFEFHSEEQHVKILSQIEDMCGLVEKNLYTGNADKESKLNMAQSSSIFNLRDGKSLVACVSITRSKYFGIKNKCIGMPARPDDIACYDVLEIYSFVVDESYRGKGFAGVFLSAAIERMRERYSLNENTYLGLHLNPRDKMMWFSFAIYLKYGFRWARVCRYGPSDMKFYGDEIAQLEYPLETAVDVILGRRRGSYIALYTRVKYFRKGKPWVDMKDTIMVGKLLQKSLKVAEEL